MFGTYLSESDSDSELSEVVESHALNGLCHFPSLGLYIKLVEVSPQFPPQPPP